ncbi:MAG: 4-alpha-glucanotransferase [Syntrophobacteria bacterium]
MKRRGSGILLHLTSLGSPFGIGDMGSSAYRFVDFLSATGQSFWQILPLNPTDPGHGNSPYHSISAYACNPLLISPELLLQDGLLDGTDLESPPEFARDRVKYREVRVYKENLLMRAYEQFKRRRDDYDYEEFCVRNSFWLEDFALFRALRAHFGGLVWSEWPRELRDRHPEALERAGAELTDGIGMEKFLQYIFFKQWIALKTYCNDRGIHLIGDMPIYVTYDSADLWSHPGLFKLNHENKPEAVAGVPPDYFSATGQLWGNPLYRWDVLRENGYEWWIKRIARNLELLDFLRIDHFRGFVAYWQVPATEKTAINGTWVEAPVFDFLKHLARRFPYLPFIAEDLGIITPDVREVMTHFEFPGMKVLLFAFGEDLPTNPYAPHNHVHNCVVYTGTHDNNTARGWFEKEATPEQKKRIALYLGREVAPEEFHRELIRLAMMSVANLVILPIQDILGLGEEARMNRPAQTGNNWKWRLDSELLTEDVAGKLLEMTEIYGRA